MRKIKQTPPLKSVHEGVQMRFTICVRVSSNVKFVDVLCRERREIQAPPAESFSRSYVPACAETFPPSFGGCAESKGERRPLKR